MAPKKSKKEEALAFLSDLDKLDAAPSTSDSPTSQPTGSTPRASTDSARPRSIESSAGAEGSWEGRTTPAPGPAQEAQDEEAQKALAFLEAQINTKRAPLSQPRSTTPRSSTPAPVGPVLQAPTGPKVTAQATNVPSPSGGGWGWGSSSLWSTATSAIQSAQKIADEGYKKVKTDGVTGGLESLKAQGVDLDKLRKGAEDRLGGIVKGVDLEKLRQELYNTTSSTLTTILNTVAPPISAHETLELWLSHPMVGYSGVEGVVYRAWMKILEQTESGELIIVWSPEHDGQDDGERGINPVKGGWTEGWERQMKEVDSVKTREEKDPKGRGKVNPNVPVTTVPIFLHLQPLLAPLPIAEPPILLTSSTPTAPSRLYFSFTLQDPAHSLRFSTVSQPCPGDWLDVEYEKSDWVEERLVEIIRTGVEVIAQDYVATRMGLKPSTGVTRPASPEASKLETEPETEDPGSKA